MDGLKKKQPKVKPIIFWKSLTQEKLCGFLAHLLGCILCSFFIRILVLVKKKKIPCTQQGTFLYQLLPEIISCIAFRMLRHLLRSTFAKYLPTTRTTFRT